jgi:hypothetical protein
MKQIGSPPWHFNDVFLFAYSRIRHPLSRPWAIGYCSHLDEPTPHSVNGVLDFEFSEFSSKNLFK